MTSIWETFVDVTLLFLKLMALFFLVRLLLMAFGITFEVPLVDRFLWQTIQAIFESSPRIPGFSS